MKRDDFERHHALAGSKKGGDAWASSPFAVIEKIPLTF
jgi:hypothetical protein